MDRDRQAYRQLKRDRQTDRGRETGRQREQSGKNHSPTNYCCTEPARESEVRVFFSPSVYDVVNGLASLEEAEGEAGTFPNQTIFILQQLHQPRHSVIMTLACPACNTTHASV